MAQLEWIDVDYTYPGQNKAAIQQISLSVNEGEFVIICGASGSGKSTLLKLMKTELLPAGNKQGAILYEGKPLSTYSHLQLSQSFGMVMQNPDSQIVMDRVMEELIFSMENIGVAPIQMRKRVAEIAQFFDLEPLLSMPILELSGGQRQLINLASVMVLQPKVLLLDEPTAQLDPVAAREFLQLVRRANEEFGITVLMTEHRLEEVWTMADRIFLMNNGTIKANLPPAAFVQSAQAEHELYLPAVGKLFKALQLKDASYITMKDAKNKLVAWKLEGHNTGEQTLTGSDTWSESESEQLLGQGNQALQEPPLLECKRIHLQYGKKSNPVLQDVSLNIFKGDFLVLFGANGSGKTTLLQALCGLLKPQAGEVLFAGKASKHIEDKLKFTLVGYLAQNPMLHFLEEKVEQELISAVERARGMNIKVDLAATIDDFGLAGLLGQHPYDLSGGEKQKLALACILMNQPRILMLDEPTKGLDPVSKLALSRRLNQERSNGTAIIMVSHDIEFAASYANRCAMLFDGRIVADAKPAVFFSENYFYTTAINRLVRDWYPHALTVEDVVEQCRVKP